MIGVWAPGAESSVTLVFCGVRHALESAEDGWWHTDQEAEPVLSPEFAEGGGAGRVDEVVVAVGGSPEPGA